MRRIKIRMRDGVKLVTTVILPKADGRYPTILLRTPYFRLFRATREHWSQGVFFAQQGYASVLQDTRGRYDSEGEFYPYTSEAQDGYDTLEWVGHQPWCNGKVGMIGASYEAGTQFLAAPEGSQYLKSMIPMFMTGDPWLRGYYAGGAFSLALNLIWLCFLLPGKTREDVMMPAYDFGKLFNGLPLITLDEKSDSGVLPYWRDYVKHYTRDNYWKSQSIRDKYHTFVMPVLLIGGWYDYYVGEVFNNYLGLVKHAPSPETALSHKVLVGPWPHGIFPSPKFGDVDFGKQSIIDLESLFLNWFNRTLHSKEPSPNHEAPIRIFVMGANEWRDVNEWPLALTKFLKYYLHSQGTANTSTGDGELSPKMPADEPTDSYTYDPNNYVPTLGGNHSVGMMDAPEEIIRPGPFDQSLIEKRNDVLVYTTQPIQKDIEITGPIIIKLYAASSASDTDFVGKLTDVYPDGRSINITEGIIRARFREMDWDKPKLIEPHTIYAYTIDLQVTSNLFKKGHRIRVQITSSNFPLWDRNPNTGHVPGQDAKLQNAHQIIYHERQYPSHIVLPIIP